MGLDEAFLVLFPIQIAAFLLTLVRKDVISAATWHALYGASLLLPYVYLLIVLQTETALELLWVGGMVSLFRFRYRVNKYLLWYHLKFHRSTHTIQYCGIPTHTHRHTQRQ